MSKTQTLPTPGQEQVQQIPLGFLCPSPHNPRTSFDEVTLRELADSIRAIGIQVPLLVRETGSPVYEIIAGHRRCKASEMAGLDTVPCIVRALTDDQAREIMVVENLQRDDLPPMEEAEAYAQLAKILGSTQAVAARVGKPIAYVTRRLQLNELGLWSQDALRSKLITIDHALLLAKLGPDEQNKNLKWALDTNAGIKTTVEAVIADVTKRRDERENGSNRWGYWQAQSVLNLKNHIEQHTGRKLATAPWDLAATNLHPDGVACLGCPSNTDDNRALFSDMAIDEATCANGACFAFKQETFVQIQMASVGDKSLRLSWKFSEAPPRMDSATGLVNEKQILRSGQWVRAKTGSCATLRRGVAVDFEEGRYMDSNGKGKPGDVLQICITPKCKAHPKACEKREKRGNLNQNSEEGKKQREERAAAAVAENKIRHALATQALDKVEKLSVDALRLSLLHNTYGLPLSLIADLKKAPFLGVRFAKAVAAMALQRSGREIHEWNSPDMERKEFLATLKMLGVDGRKAWEKKPELKVKASKPAAKKKVPPASKKPAKKKVGAR